MEQANGVYEKVLSATDVADKMSVPTHWVGEMLAMPEPGKTTELLVRDQNGLPVRDQNGNDTTLQLAVRRHKEGQQSYHMKPYFRSKEWRALVNAYDLKKGDSVYFWWQGNYLRVSRAPPIMLFGACIGINGNG